MEKYITYYKPDTDKYYIEKAVIKYNQCKRPIIHGGYIIGENYIFDTLEKAKNSLKDAKRQIVEL